MQQLILLHVILYNDITLCHAGKFLTNGAKKNTKLMEEIMEERIMHFRTEKITNAPYRF
jgi:hypothetical protein